MVAILNNKPDDSSGVKYVKVFLFFLSDSGEMRNATFDMGEDKTIRVNVSGYEDATEELEMRKVYIADAQSHGRDPNRDVLILQAYTDKQNLVSPLTPILWIEPETTQYLSAEHYIKETSSKGILEPIVRQFLEEYHGLKANPMSVSELKND